jgi:hypothetical protein
MVHGSAAGRDDGFRSAPRFSLGTSSSILAPFGWKTGGSITLTIRSYEPPPEETFLLRGEGQGHGHPPRRRQEALACLAFVVPLFRPRLGHQPARQRLAENPAGNALSGIRYLEREEQEVHPLPEPWRHVHRAAHAGRLGASPAGEPEAWPIRALHMTASCSVEQESL